MSGLVTVHTDIAGRWVRPTRASTGVTGAWPTIHARHGREGARAVAACVAWACHMSGDISIGSIWPEARLCVAGRHRFTELFWVSGMAIER
jgi:hypothetical protein